MFIVLDAIDGAGKGKQREELIKIFSSNNNLQFQSEGFPVHNSFYEKVIHPALQQSTKLNNSSWVLAYLLDKTLYTEKIKPYINNPNNLFIADGYFTTTIAYQSLLMNQVSLNKLIEYSTDFEIPKPDLAIYLDVDPEVAYKRKLNEEGHNEGLDMFEKSLDKQKKLRTIFKKMVNEQIYCKWEEIDGNGTIEEVKNILQNIIEKLIS